MEFPLFNLRPFHIMLSNIFTNNFVCIYFLFYHSPLMQTALFHVVHIHSSKHGIYIHKNAHSQGPLHFLFCYSHTSTCSCRAFTTYTSLHLLEHTFLFKIPSFVTLPTQQQTLTNKSAFNPLHSPSNPKLHTALGSEHP